MSDWAEDALRGLLDVPTAPGVRAQIARALMRLARCTRGEANDGTHEAAVEFVADLVEICVVAAIKRRKRPTVGELDELYSRLVAFAAAGLDPTHN